MCVVRVAGAERPSRGLVRVPKRLQALDEGGVPTRARTRTRSRAMRCLAAQLGTRASGPQSGGIGCAGSGLRFDVSFDKRGSRATTSIH